MARHRQVGQGVRLHTLCMAAMLVGMLGMLNAGAADAKDVVFVGVGKCKSCHSAKETGDQYGAWAAEKHSKTFAVLATDAAKKIAKDKGIADPQKSDECLSCHVTAHGVDKKLIHKKFDPTQGVQCESCHGAGDKHAKARMSAEPEEVPAGAAPKLAKVGEGEINRVVSQETCKACHNPKSPTYKPFCMKERAKAIAHLDPRRNHPADYFDKLPCDCEKCKK